MKLYLDLDGVLADFDAKYTELFGPRPTEEEKKHGHFWDNWKSFVDNKSFEDLPLHRDALLLLNAVKILNVPTEILSSSGGGYSHDEVIAQKKVWLKKHGIDFPANFSPGGKRKANWAAPRHVLIDDTPKNIEAFESAGGTGILHKNAHDTISKLHTLYNKWVAK